jgi:predicted phosphodiesterase
MERVAVITDIHANLPALEAVMAAIEWTDVDAVYCGGDLVGYGQRPARTATSSWSGTPTNPRGIRRACGGGVGLADRVRGEAGNGSVRGRTR